MKALITGASTGFGRDFAIKLSEQGYDIVAVARSKEKLEELKKEIKTNVEIEVMDLSQKENEITNLKIIARAKRESGFPNSKIMEMLI